MMMLVMTMMMRMMPPPLMIMTMLLLMEHRSVQAYVDITQAGHVSVLLHTSSFIVLFHYFFLLHISFATPGTQVGIADLSDCDPLICLHEELEAAKHSSMSVIAELSAAMVLNTPTVQKWISSGSSTQ